MKLAPKKSLSLFSILPLTLLGLAAATTARAQNNLQVYVSAPGTATDTYANAQIETFNSFATGTFTQLSSSALTLNGTNATYTLGGSTSPAPSISANNQYAASASSGQYLSVTPGNSVTLTLATAVPYVGIDVPALDNGNSFTFYDASGAKLGTFSAATVTSIFSGTTVRAINGTVYQTSSYKGQPGNTSTSNNSGELYAYLHFFAQNGTSIKSIVFSQASGGNFETENHSILTTAPAVDTSFVVVPEPGTGVAITIGCAGLLALGRLRRRLR